MVPFDAKKIREAIHKANVATPEEKIPQKRLDEHKGARWCRSPVLDAVFTSYFNQARNQGIVVEAQISN